MNDRDSHHSATDAATPTIPQAVVRSGAEVSGGRLRTRLWWLTGVCIILALGLVISSFRTHGQHISITFLEGHGLKAGDTLRYRGIDIGSVTTVALARDLQGVQVDVQLVPGNESIAVQGSQFWIQRARLRLGQVTGLDTVMGAKYLGVVPGQASSPPATHFTGQETPLGFTDSQTLEIRILFPAGEGLEEGDPIRFRGIAVGEVSYVELSPGLESVAVGARLVGSACELARVGTQFWIERPRLDLTEVRGLETLLGGRYIAMQPSSLDSPTDTHFTGLAEPPPLPRRDGSLEIELDAPRRLGLVRGAPVTYRGLEVGRIGNVGLARDGASVKVSATIEPEYAELIRDNSKWWSTGGIQFNAGLSGFQLSIESLSTWVRGGIAFATPLEPGERVVTGHRFMLEAEPQPAWLDWQPRIALQGSSMHGAVEIPSPVRVVASWQASWLGFYRRRTLETWGVALADGSLCVPANFIQLAATASDAVTVEVAGQSFPMTDLHTNQLSDHPQLPLASLPLPQDSSVPLWPVQDISDQWSSQTVLLVVNPELSEPLALDGTRLSQDTPHALDIAPGVAIAPGLSGSPVVNATSGKLIGLLILNSGRWSIGVFAR